MKKYMLIWALLMLAPTTMHLQGTQEPAPSLTELKKIADFFQLNLMSSDIQNIEDQPEVSIDCRK